MINRLEKTAAAELLTKLYRGSQKRNLLIDDGSPSGWKESDVFPKVGEEELLIRDIQIHRNLMSFVSVLRKYFLDKPGVIFFFLQEEYLSGSDTIDIECDLNSIDEVVKLVDEVSNLNTILFDDSFSWVVKFHHELFGYLSGNEELCNQIKESSLASSITKPVWL